ncbi:MAG TPA: hypothetical protein VGV39_01080 [Mesorhizobium sp.]|jgi:hypothetical protein|uniref:hypothetical protein n=1 Tax=Mesorhizobium sp. TaxID=1871066 RepID=UPI002DDCBC97|nr:hypothetical protein [Mesorhizobium sp.]HEV2501635.1 hypothetical protein [Mesorhizobium sp.]
MSKTLLEAMAEVDVIDAAGRILANPARNAPAATTATIYALAMATERMWAVCVEAELLARAEQFPITGNDHDDNVRDDAIQQQTHRVLELMAALRGETSKDEDHAGK